MATDGISPALAIRSSVGVDLWHAADANNVYITNDEFPRDESKFCRAIEFSPDGRYLAWANGSKVQVTSVNDWSVDCSLPRPRAIAIKFSPKGTYIATLEHYSTPKDESEPQPNFLVYEISTGEAVFAIINKSFPDDWMPGWSNDEFLFALMVGGEAYFYETTGSNGFQKSAKKIGGSRGGELSIAGGGSNPHVALYVPGDKGQQCVCKIFRYPAVDGNQIVASKSFYQADRVEMMWNKRASAGFGNLRGSVEVWDANDKKLITTFQAPDSTLLEWGPDGEKILTATTAPRLRIGNGFKVWHYSGALLHETSWPAGQELLQVIWQKYGDGIFKEKPISNVKVKGIEISQPQASKAVYIPPNIRSGVAAPVGASPRATQYQPIERGPIPGLPIGYKTSQGQKKKERNAKRKEGENASKPSANVNSHQTANSNELGNATQAQNQSTPSSNNKRNPRRTPRQQNNPNQTNGNGTNNHNNTDSSVNANSNVTASNEQSSPETGDNQDKSKRERRPRTRPRKDGAPGSSGDAEKEKRFRTVQQKLRDIAKLKVRRDNGENLEVNQLSKISLEAELIKELTALKVDS